MTTNRPVIVFEMYRDDLTTKPGDRTRKREKYRGHLLAFSTNFIELSQGGVGQFPVVLIEKPDGTIDQVDIDMVQFVKVKEVHIDPKITDFI